MMMIGSSVDYVRSGGMRNVPVTKAVEHLYATTAKCSGCVLLPATSVSLPVGISGNEIADIAAKNASAVLDNSTSLQDFKRYINLALHSRWENHWNSQSMNKLRSIKPVVGTWPTLTKIEKRIQLSLGYEWVTLDTPIVIC
ncbi:hypothetical protein AVEN_153242-1 [Araneus ventricosus]|uniref:Uncharacterized protein n=1 Tax=Araneus ventricosus TaxID=182803 RepID=A0A4Y2WRU8_ARAVE|nr:hypothetical protein AVEN_153242-1 [Araneus ventricosus]